VIDQLSQYDQTLDEILREERRDRGRRGGLIGGRLGDRVRWIGFEDIDENVLYNDTAVHLIESLVPNFWEMLGRYEALFDNPEFDGYLVISTDPLAHWANNLRTAYHGGRLSDEIIQAVNSIGSNGRAFQWTSPRPQSRGGAPSGSKFRPRLTFEEKLILLREAIRVNGSVDIRQYPPMTLNFTFPGNQERFQKEDGSQWDEWPVGTILFAFRKTAKGQGTGIALSEEQITRLEALTDEAGNHLRIRPESE
jgi:hypothetical protein